MDKHQEIENLMVTIDDARSKLVTMMAEDEYGWMKNATQAFDKVEEEITDYSTWLDDGTGDDD